MNFSISASSNIQGKNMGEDRSKSSHQTFEERKEDIHSLMFNTKMI
jgi:hypothetical protein